MSVDDDQLVNEMMPNSSEAIGMYLPELEEATGEDRGEEIAERVAIATALPLIEELLDWFSEQIAACDSIKQLLMTRDQSQLDFPAAIAAHDIVRELLEAKRDNLKARYEDFNERNEVDEPS